MTETTEREAFEAWIRTAKNWKGDESVFLIGEDGLYDLAAMQGGFDVWQARAALASSTQPIGGEMTDAAELAAFEEIISDKAGPGAITKWLGTTGYKNTRVQDYREGWLWALDWLKSTASSTQPTSAVAPTAQQLRDIIAAVPDIGDKAAREFTIARMSARATTPPPMAKVEPIAQPVVNSSEFIQRTNIAYSAWCKNYYQADALDERGMASLHGLWAWQEQERRNATPPPVAGDANYDQPQQVPDPREFGAVHLSDRTIFVKHDDAAIAARGSQS